MVILQLLVLNHILKIQKMELMTELIYLNLASKYNIPISQEFREDVRIMCNLSTGIEERAAERATKKATEKTSEKFILNMYKKGYTLDQIADVAETGVDEVEAIIKKKEPAMA